MPASDTSSSPPWRAAFLSHVSKMDSPEFVFSTVRPSDDKSSPSPYVPRARYCIYRGMWAELPFNKYSTAPQNEHVYASELLTITTDARMEKVAEIFASSGEAREEGDQSGGGAPVEAVFYVRETMTQWRFKGTAYIVGPDIEGSSPAALRVKRKIAERMRPLSDAEERLGDWSWTREITAHFGNLSPGMRGSFRNPIPGSPASATPSDPGLALGQKVDDLHDETARANFRVVVIAPDEVDQVELRDAERARRWQFRFTDEAPGSWKEEELWP